MQKDTLVRAWILSFIGYFLYWVGNRIPAPYMATDFLQLTRNSHVLNTNFGNFFQFGIVPLIVGFFLVELLSFVVRPLNIWRQSGVQGRQRLNIVSLLVSLVIVSIQAYGFISYMKNAPLPNGEMVWQNLNLLQDIAIVAFYWVGTLAIYVLGKWMTKKGIANGFAFIMLVDIIFSLYDTITNHISTAIRLDVKYYTPGLVFLALSMYVFWRFFLKKRHVSTVEFKHTKIQYQLPLLPQGILGHIWTLNLIILPLTLRTYFDIPYFEHDSWPYIIAYILVVPFVSYFAYYVAYAPRRIENNVDGIQLNDEFRSALKKQLWLSIVMVSGLSFLLFVPRPFESGKLLTQIFTLNQILIIYYISIDIVRHSRFLKDKKHIATLFVLDNIHLAEAQRALLQANGIESHIQGQEFRNLYAFTNPIYKMCLIVDKEDQQKAEQILQLDHIKIV